MQRIMIGTNKGFVYKSEYKDFGITSDVAEAHVFNTLKGAREVAEGLVGDGSINCYVLSAVVDFKGVLHHV